MAVSSLGDLWAALAQGRWGDVTGTHETDWVDFKRDPYQLGAAKGDWELAKDVASLANTRGGVIVVGFDTCPLASMATDVVTEHRPTRRALVNGDQILPSSPAVSTLVFATCGCSGFQRRATWQSSRLRCPLRTNVRSPSCSRELSVTTVDSTRGRSAGPGEGANVEWVRAAEIHNLIRDGMAGQRGVPPGQDLIGQVEQFHRGTSRWDEIIQAMNWVETPCVLLQAVPPVGTRGPLRTLHEEGGVRGRLRSPLSLRRFGFNLDTQFDLAVRDGALTYLTDPRRAIWLDMDGTFTVGSAGTENWLGYNLNEGGGAASPLNINSLVLTEFSLEALRFVHQVLVPLAPGEWCLRARVANLKTPRLTALHEGPPDPWTPRLLRSSPPNAGEMNAVVLRSPGEDVYAFLRWFYALYGLPVSAIPAVSQWSYDSNFRRASHTVGGVSITYGFDNDSLLVQAGAATLGRTPSTGQLSSVSLGSVRTVLTPNEYGELATLTTTAGATPVYSEGLSYDAAGRIRVVEEVILGVPIQWVYGYDKVGRLTSASKNGSAPTTWTYDGNGNRITENAVISTFDAQDRPKTRGATTYEFDALGGRRLKTDGSAVTQYTHDGLGALTSVTLPDSTVVTYEYDARQRRVAKRRNGIVVKRWVYDGQYRVVAEVDGAGSVMSRFIYASQSHSPDYLVRGALTYTYVKNHLGSVKLVVDSGSGAVLQQVEYGPWGNVASNTAPDFQPFAFAGGIYDPETDLTHFGYRDYDGECGVWSSKDPARLVGGLNSYSAHGGRPTQIIDPTGLWTFQIGVGGQFGVLAGVDGQIGLAFDGEGRVGFFESGGLIGGPFGAGGVGLNFTVNWDADSIHQLAGSGLEAGVLLGPVSGGYSGSRDGPYTQDQCQARPLNGLFVSPVGFGIAYGAYIGNDLTTYVQEAFDLDLPQPSAPPRPYRPGITPLPGSSWWW